MAALKFERFEKDLPPLAVSVCCSPISPPPLPYHAIASQVSPCLPAKCRKDG